jgi:hypothetical protein
VPDPRGSTSLSATLLKLHRTAPFSAVLAANRNAASDLLHPAVGDVQVRSGRGSWTCFAAAALLTTAANLRTPKLATSHRPDDVAGGTDTLAIADGAVASGPRPGAAAGRPRQSSTAPRRRRPHPGGAKARSQSSAVVETQRSAIARRAAVAVLVCEVIGRLGFRTRWRSAPSRASPGAPAAPGGHAPPHKQRSTWGGGQHTGTPGPRRWIIGRLSRHAV